MEAITAIDGAAYRRSTRDFRNLSSHAVAQRFEIGITRLVERSVVQKTEMKQRKDGAYDEGPVPSAMSVSYGFGGTPSLVMREVAAHNLEEYEKAAACFKAYVRLLGETLSAIPEPAQVAKVTHTHQ